MIENLFLLLGVGPQSALLADVVYWFTALGVFGFNIASHFHEQEKTNLKLKLQGKDLKTTTASELLVLLIAVVILSLAWPIWLAVVIAARCLKLYDKIKVWYKNQKAVD